MSDHSSADSSISAPPGAPDAVSRRAFEIWEREGRPEGCDLRHWLQAEEELSARAGTAGAAGTAPVRDANPATAAGPRNTGTDTRPLEGTRAAQAAGRGRRNSATPFVAEGNGNGSSPSGSRRKASNPTVL